MNWLKFYIKTHNYLGLVLSVFFLLLFTSGLVMMFVGYPRYYDQYRLPEIPALKPNQTLLSAAEAQNYSGISATPEDVRLNTLQDRPVYRFEHTDGTYAMVFADNGEVLGKVDAETALRSVQWYTQVNQIDSEIEALGLMREVDAWTTNPGFSGTPHWPFYKFKLGDAKGTQVYVSSVTAEVVHRTTFSQRFWGILGPILHYFYVPIELRQHPNAWFWVVVIISGVGSVLCVFGLIVGVWLLRWRQLGRVLARSIKVKAKAQTRPILPYKGWLYWHNYLGMIFGVITFTWIFSGMMSMNPFNFESTAPTIDEATHWTEGKPDPALLNNTFADALLTCLREIDVKEIRLRQFAGQAYYYCMESANSTRVVFDNNPKAALLHLPQDLLQQQVAQLMPGEAIAETSWLNEYDSYYQYGRPERIGDSIKRLPVMRIKFNDSANSWYYIDPHSGSILSRYRADSRTNRWLFDALHTLDFAWLHEHRHVLWWVFMIVLMAGGTVLSFTSLWLTLKWLWKQLPFSEANEDSGERVAA